MTADDVGHKNGVVAWGSAAGKGQHGTKQKGAGAKGSGQMVTDEDMADGEMAGRRRGKSNCLTGLRHNHRRLLSVFRTYEKLVSPRFWTSNRPCVEHHIDEEETRAMGH